MFLPYLSCASVCWFIGWRKRRAPLLAPSAQLLHQPGVENNLPAATAEQRRRILWLFYHRHRCLLFDSPSQQTVCDVVSTAPSIKAIIVAAWARLIFRFVIKRVVVGIADARLVSTQKPRDFLRDRGLDLGKFFGTQTSLG